MRARDIYLPDNTLGWYDYHSGHYYSGGQTVQRAAPLEQLPLYVRAGSIIAEGSLMHADSADADTERTLRLYPAKGNEKSEGTLYDDNGTATNGEHWQLHWRLHGHGDELYLRLNASGDYQPAYLDNLRVTLPPNETRRLIISGNLDVQQT